MRIARIIEYFSPHIGGMERHGLALSREQVKLGHEVEIFIGYDGSRDDSRSDLEDSLRSDLTDFKIYKAPLQFLPTYTKIRRFWFNFWAYNKIKKNHKKNPYNVIHLHGDFVEAYFGGKLSKKLNIPAVLTIHAGLNKRLLKPKNAKYFKNISKIICVSEEIANDLKSIDIPENKLAAISSGIYLAEFENVDNNKITAIQNQYSQGSDPWETIIISVGVLRANKGFDFLIGAFKEVLKKFNSATLLIIGDGSEKNILMKQAEGIGQIKFLGRQNHNKVIEYLKAAGIFALASISTEGDREGTSTSIMEAMAAGLPVITTRVGGNPYLIKEGENGLLVEEKKSELLAEAMLQLIDDKNLRQQISEKNLEDIKQKDWPTVAKKITDVYFR